MSRVGVAGGLSEGATGSARVELYWSERGLRQVAVARQVRGDLAAGAGSNDGRPEIRGDVTEFLAQVDADVEVVRVESTLLRSGVRYSAFGWEVVGALAWALVGLSIATVFVLVTAREHWRATPWAWFWLILLVPPLGALGYLVGGGPTGVRRPGPASGRLTGGWAFLLAVVASSLW